MLGLSASTRKNGIRQLDAPVQMSSMNIGVTDDITNMTSIWMTTQKGDRFRHVDQKKLEKAEAKLLQKQDKRNAESSKPVSASSGQDCQASAAQVISKKDTKLVNKSLGRNQDIRIENFDVAYGEKWVAFYFDMFFGFWNKLSNFKLLKFQSADQGGQHIPNLR